MSQARPPRPPSITKGYYIGIIIKDKEEVEDNGERGNGEMEW
jgi:hypothetical protein